MYFFFTGSKWGLVMCFVLIVHKINKSVSVYIILFLHLKLNISNPICLMDTYPNDLFLKSLCSMIISYLYIHYMILSIIVDELGFTT